ncbi:hypothetical protein [Bartonella choladocola]|uniref:Uncharacterized protein n=1 Tax=Bartonella choladocola TaxID=2750995 RepID=A0A1U9MJ63_9HYPH|nr:hypothetical protein [Bartonella choladocola]AQT47955.1 hypothetical protein BBC0122_018600 [Bartonella choladocola]
MISIDVFDRLKEKHSLITAMNLTAKVFSAYGLTSLLYIYSGFPPYRAATPTSFIKSKTINMPRGFSEGLIDELHKGNGLCTVLAKSIVVMIEEPHKISNDFSSLCQTYGFDKLLFVTSKLDGTYQILVMTGHGLENADIQKIKSHSPLIDLYFYMFNHNLYGLNVKTIADILNDFEKKYLNDKSIGLITDDSSDIDLENAINGKLSTSTIEQSVALFADQT